MVLIIDQYFKADAGRDLETTNTNGIVSKATSNHQVNMGSFILHTHGQNAKK